MELFNICSADRKIREVVAAEPTILGLKKAAFQLLKKPILALVMEASGFKVSNDQVLKLIKHNIVMVLTLNEIWTEAEVEHSTLGCVQQQQQTKTEARVTEQSDNEELVDVIVPDEEFDETDENENLSLQNTSELQAKHTPAKNISIELQHLAEVTPSTSNKESQPCEQFGDEDLDVTTNVNESAPLLNAPELNDQTSEQSPLLGDVSPSSNQSTKGSASGQQLEQEPCTSGKSPKRSQQQAVKLGTKLNEISLSPGPGLIAVDLGSSQCAYYVFADSARLSEGASTILIALQDLFGILYINNFMYPKGNSKFLEFIQQYFLKIIPAYGSKSKATRVGKQQRVVNRLISELSSINNIAEQ
uniref:(northern house mosquito) hypothetical protein n=2 Tax=Culex pipiens TaxID=7175 RepID=A0A8D8NC24_CULPI